MSQTEIHPVQLPLGVSLSDAYTFANYFSASNEFVTRSLHDFLNLPDFQFVYLWGAHNSGKTHLLQACSAQASTNGESACYIPCRQFDEHEHRVLDGLDNLNLVCIDDVDSIASCKDWEQKLFSLFNMLRDRKARLIVSASGNIAECGFDMPDLISRMQWGLSLRLLLLDDEQKAQALKYRCEGRGIDINIDVIHWLIKHISRDMASLYEFIEAAIEQAIMQQRRLTIPFIKSLDIFH